MDYDHTPYPIIDYKIFAQIDADSSSDCQATAAFNLLGTSEITPTISIVAEEAGVVVGYSVSTSYKAIGTLTSSHAVWLDPLTLGVLKHINMTGGYSPPGCVAGGPGSTYLSQVSIINHSDLVVDGGLGGNSVCTTTLQGPGGGLGCSQCDGTGAHLTGFSATFPAFFTSSQPGNYVTY